MSFDWLKTDFPTLDKALRHGAKLISFIFKSKLRVVNVVRKKMVGYGEGRSFEEALAQADKDYSLGHRKYTDVYPIHMKGFPEASNHLDAWLLMNHKLWVQFEDESYIIGAKGEKYVGTPDAVVKWVTENKTPRLWRRGNKTYRTRIHDFVSGTGVQTEVVHLCPHEGDDEETMVKPVDIVYSNPTFTGALEVAEANLLAEFGRDESYILLPVKELGESEESLVMT
jgi:hypothetical protein